ncbi:C5a anaphylatoxin chemotactic receptor 1-like isoform 1-T2 [Anomaloglossus baeobatrachus]
MGFLIFGNQTIEIPPDNNDWSLEDQFYYMNITRKIAITLLSIVFALKIIGNGLVIWIAGFRMKQTISAVWFLHLAIADLLCCASLPGETFPLVLEKWWDIRTSLTLLPDTHIDVNENYNSY